MPRRPSAALMLAALVALLVLVAPAGPASAGEASFSDARGDAPSPHDITDVQIRNDRERVSVRLQFVDLRHGEQIVRSFLDSVRADLHWIATTVIHRDGRVTAALETFTGSEFERVDCRIVGSWQFVRDTVRISFPQSCLDIHRALRVRVLAGAGDGTTGDPADWTRTVRVPYA